MTKTYGNLILWTTVVVVAFWIIMATSPRRRNSLDRLWANPQTADTWHRAEAAELPFQY